MKLVYSEESLLGSNYFILIRKYNLLKNSIGGDRDKFYQDSNETIH